MAHGAVFSVDTTADGLDNFPGDGVCNDGSGRCTLRAAVMEASSLPGFDEIRLGIVAAPHVLSIAGVGEDAAALGDLDVTGDTNIVRVFWQVQTKTYQPVVVDGSALDRVFHVHPGANLTIQGITIQNGRVTTEDGGGILNEGKLELSSTTVSGNVTFESGGGIYSSGPVLKLTTSTVIANSSAQWGGGIRNESGELTLVGSDVSGNFAVGQGGGIASSGHSATTRSGIAELNVLNSTVSGNVSAGSIDGATVAGIYNSGNGFLLNSTVSGNRAESPDAVYAVGVMQDVSGGLFSQNSTIADHAIGIWVLRPRRSEPAIR